MKKRICFIMTMFISLFIFSNKVDAIYMYLECDYTNECADNVGSIIRTCYEDFKHYVPLTDKNGNIIYIAFTKELANAGKDFQFRELHKDCWLQTYTIKSCSDTTSFDFAPSTIFQSGQCPSGVVNQHIGSYFIPFGTDGHQISKSDNITETKYVIYSFFDENGIKHLIAEGYNDEGRYCYAGSNLKKNILKVGIGGKLDDISGYIYEKAYKDGFNYWKVHTNFDARMISTDSNNVSLGGINVCAGLTEAECKNSKYKYEVIIDSEDSNNNIEDAVINWYNKVINESEELKQLATTLSKDKFIETCTKFNNAMNEGKKYNFSYDYTQEMFINDLNAAYEAIETAYGADKIIVDYSTGKGTSASSSIVSYIYEEMLGISEIVEIAEKDDKEYHVNINYIVSAIKRDVSETLENYISNNDLDIDIINTVGNILEYMEMFYTSVAYLDRDSSIYKLDTSQILNIESLKEKFEDFVEENSLNFRPVIDCESLLGEELIAKINKYLDIFKIAVPIILIGLGIIDFTKAIFASDEDKMKKAKDTFIKRLFVAILIFLSPILVNLILSLANKVWSFISPNSCGFFQ